MLTRVFILYKIESFFQNLIMNIFLQLTVNKDQKLLHQLGFSDEQVLTVKTSGSGTPSGSSADSSTSSSNSSSVFSSSYAMEQVQHSSLEFERSGEQNSSGCSTQLGWWNEYSELGQQLFISAWASSPWQPGFPLKNWNKPFKYTCALKHVNSSSGKQFCHSV